MKIEEISQFVKGVDGWLTDKEGRLLYHLAKNCRGHGVIVEIGSWKGKSTIWLAAGAKAGKKIPVYAIDHHKGSPEHYQWYGAKDIWTFDEFQKNLALAGVADIVIPVVKTSAAAAKDFNQPVELIFIDGAHQYELVKLDFELWFPKLIEGGVMVVHDTAGWAPWPGPIKMVKEKIYHSLYFKDIGLVHSITFAKKVKINSPQDRWKNQLMSFIRFPSEIIGKLNLKIILLIKSIKMKKKGLDAPAATIERHSQPL